MLCFDHWLRSSILALIIYTLSELFFVLMRAFCPEAKMPRSIEHIFYKYCLLLIKYFRIVKVSVFDNVFLKFD